MTRVVVGLVGLPTIALSGVLLSVRKAFNIISPLVLQQLVLFLGRSDVDPTLGAREGFLWALVFLGMGFVGAVANGQNENLRMRSGFKVGVARSLVCCCCVGFVGVVSGRLWLPSLRAFDS